MPQLEKEDNPHRSISLTHEMDDANSDAHSARPQTAGEADDSVGVTTKKPVSATGEDTLPVMEPGNTTETGAGQDEQGPLAGHNDDDKYLEFHGEKTPVHLNPNTVKVYKSLQKEFGSVDAAVRRQQELIEMSRISTGLVPVKEEEEIVIKVEENEENEED